MWFVQFTNGAELGVSALLIFNGDIETPLVANIIQDCNILVSIVYANSWIVKGKTYGQLIMKLPYYSEDILKLKKYLDMKGVEYEEVMDYELGQYN